MNGRSYLKKSVLLCGESDQGRFKRTFLIQERLPGAGASAVCYRASYEGGSCGILKEFYPLDVPSLVRDADGQILRCTGTEEDRRVFEQLLEEYVAPYRMLQEARRQDELATFLPPFEIYYGSDADCHPIGTVYIWSPEPRLETFDRVCDEIHAHPTVRPEYHLLHVLYAMESLVKCVLALHKAGLIHRDIKPSNFGFVKRGDELLTQSISLFDVDTICSVYHVPTGVARFSEGFAEPEVKTMSPCPLTDIFSIGATLFHAIIVCEEARAGGDLYHPAFYAQLRQMVDSSELITASETNSHPHLRAILTRILQKTLCLRRDRYQCCEALLADVQRALYYVIPAELSGKGHPAQQWILADADQLRELDCRSENHSTPALQHLLYTVPLYADCPPEQKALDVLVIGFGKYGQRFLDIVLQIGQMPGKQLSVTVVSDSAEDKAVYLNERPELGRFFDVDGSLPDDPECYGAIRFVTHTLPADAPADNAAFLHSLFPAGSTPDYAFVAVGQDSLTLSLAASVQPFCRTCFVWEGKALALAEYGEMHPVYVNADISRDAFFTELERMAFNVHLLWNKHLRIPFRALRKDFRKPYHYNSCISFVLSVQYKMYAIGIRSQNRTAEEQAQAYLAYISAHETQKNELIWLEHRRWVTEKLCAGYRCMTNLEECARGQTKDERLKRHICIVRSRPDAGLSAPDWTTKEGLPDPDKWDHPVPEALERLDALDRMSVELHLMYRRHAEEQGLSNVLVSAVTGQTEQDPACAAAFRELLHCMHQIQSAHRDSLRLYEGLRTACLSSVRASSILRRSGQRTLLRLMDSLHEQFYPVMAAQMYRDYKKDDAVLVEGIPFILTYSHAVCMMIPYSAGNPTAVFDNLAAACIIRPDRLLYLAYCQDDAELRALRRTLPRLTGYMSRREMHAKAEFLIGCTPALCAEYADVFAQECRTQGGRIHSIRLVPAASETAFADAIRALLQGRRKSSRRFLLELNDTPLSGALEAADFPAHFPYFRFDATSMQFTMTRACNALQYIRNDAFLTVSDLFPDAASYAAPIESLVDCKALWSRCSTCGSAWKALATRLHAYTNAHDCIASFTRNCTASKTEGICRWLLPAGCRSAAERILNAFTAEGIIGSASRVQSITADSCAVEILDFYGNRSALDALFARPDLLLQTDLICCRTEPETHTVQVLYQGLVVRGFDCRALPEESLQLLTYFRENGLLNNLSFTEQSADFAFAAPQIRELLTKEERLLMLYVCRMAKESGRFDDIRSREELGIREDAFDLVLTRGYSSLFVKCLTEPNSASSKRLAAFAGQYGIHADTMLIIHTEHALQVQTQNNSEIAGTLAGLLTGGNRQIIKQEESL